MPYFRGSDGGSHTAECASGRAETEAQGDDVATTCKCDAEIGWERRMAENGTKRTLDV